MRSPPGRFSGELGHYLRAIPMFFLPAVFEIHRGAVAGSIAPAALGSLYCSYPLVSINGTRSRSCSIGAAIQ